MKPPAAPKAKPGRPAEMKGGQKVTMYLDAAAIRRARVIGEGNLSAGVREALLAFRDA